MKFSNLQQVLDSGRYNVKDLIPGQTFQLGHTYWIERRHMCVTLVERNKRSWFGITSDGLKVPMANFLDIKVDKELVLR